MYDGIKQLTSADEPAFAKAKAFAAYCFAQAGAGGVMRATQLELARIPKLAPYVIVLGVIEDGADFHVRLAGTRLVDEFLGANPTGAKLSQILKDDEFGKRSWHIVRETMRSKQPVLNQPGRTRLRAKDYMQLETITFPLADEAGSVAKVVSFYDYTLEKRSSEASLSQF